MLLRFLARRIDRKCAPPKRFRPVLEGLEAREVPATLHWTGAVSEYVTDPDNWQGGVLPQRGDDLIFDTGSRNCNALNPMQGGGGPIEGFSSSPYDFNSISVLSGYSGSVIVQGGILVGDLVLTGGDLRQPNGDLSTVTVANTFNWTGGTLNASTSRSTLAIRGGATATITPPTSGALVTGSTLSFEDDTSTSTGSTGTFKAGTIEWNNDAHWFIAAESEVVFDMTNGDLDFEDSGYIPHHLQGKLTLLDNSGAGLGTHRTKRVTVNVGYLVMRDEILYFLDTPTDTDQASFNQHKDPDPNREIHIPTLEMRTGTKMWVSNWAQFRDGQILIKSEGASNEVAIEGNVSFGPQGAQEDPFGFAVYFFTPGDYDNKLVIDGNCTVHYTTFYINYHRNTNNASNLMVVQGTLYYFGDSHIEMLPASSDHTPPRTATYLVWQCLNIDYSYDPFPPDVQQLSHTDWWKRQWHPFGLVVYADYGVDG
jgi:hypothetical protein